MIISRPGLRQTPPRQFHEHFKRFPRRGFYVICSFLKIKTNSPEFDPTSLPWKIKSKQLLINTMIRSEVMPNCSGGKRIYSLNSIPTQQHTDTITTRTAADPKTTATTTSGSRFSTAGEGRWRTLTPASSSCVRSTDPEPLARTFFTHEEPYAADGAGVVEAVVHLTVVRPGASPPDRQQEYRLFRWPVHHIVEASSVTQEGFVEEPPVPWLGTSSCLAVEPQANHCIVLSHIIIITHGHGTADWHCWRHCGP